jgi:hypothetical protein
MDREERRKARKLRRDAIRKHAEVVRELRREAKRRGITSLRSSEYIKHRLSGKTPTQAMKLATAEWQPPENWTQILAGQDEIAKLPEFDDRGSSVRTVSGGSFEMNRRKH